MHAMESVLASYTDYELALQKEAFLLCLRFRDGTPALDPSLSERSVRSELLVSLRKRTSMILGNEHTT